MRSIRIGDMGDLLCYWAISWKDSNLSKFRGEKAAITRPEEDSTLSPEFDAERKKERLQRMKPLKFAAKPEPESKGEKAAAP